jgi:hypothetical protein
LRSVFYRLLDERKIANVRNFDVHEVAVCLDQPPKVSFDTGTRQIVEQTDSMSLGQQTMSQVRPDKAGATGD